VKVIAKCPITGEDVFPDASTLRNAGDNIIICPACQREHIWLPTEGKLTEVAGAEAPNAEASTNRPTQDFGAP
jgi:hypothetical protein